MNWKFKLEITICITQISIETIFLNVFSGWKLHMCNISSKLDMHLYHISLVFLISSIKHIIIHFIVLLGFFSLYIAYFFTFSISQENI